MEYEKLEYFAGQSEFFKQWGKSIHGWVAFPVAFSKHRVLCVNHQGQRFMMTKVVEYNSLDGFTLDVENNDGISNDAQWIAVGF